MDRNTILFNGAEKSELTTTEDMLKAVYEALDEKGYNAIVVFVIQMKEMKYFTPNDTTHPEFCEILRQASNKGVRIIAIDCKIESDSISADENVPILL